jgi:hypothetical protein
MNTDQNWYRQLMALVLLSASKAAVEFIVNPDSREEGTDQLRSAFASIDYDAVAQQLTQAIDGAAAASKSGVNGAIDNLRDRSVEVVDTAKTRAEKQLGQKGGGHKLKFFIGLVLGAIVAYFLLNEQRRDDLLDRLTGASGPIEQSVQSAAPAVTSMAQQATQKAASEAGSTGSTASGGTA